MAITVNWGIDRLLCTKNLNGNTNVVTVVYWFCEAYDDETNKKNKIHGHVGLPNPSPENEFVIYENLTLDQILTWCSNEPRFNKETIEQIAKAALITPTDIDWHCPTLPF